MSQLSAAAALRQINTLWNDSGTPISYGRFYNDILAGRIAAGNDQSGRICIPQEALPSIAAFYGLNKTNAA